MECTPGCAEAVVLEKHVKLDTVSTEAHGRERRNSKHETRHTSTFRLSCVAKNKEKPTNFRRNGLDQSISTGFSISLKLVRSYYVR